MQRLVFLSSSSRLVQVIGNNYSKLLFKRTLATKNSKIDPHESLYTASTAKKQQNISADLKGGQPPETYNTTSTPSVSTGGKVWSAQNPDGVHIAPLGRVQATTFTASTTDQNPTMREATVYTTQGKLNIADPFTTHTLKSDATAQQIAEAEAASAFDVVGSSPAATPTTTETVFAPKISSTEVYSTTMSPTAHFDSPVSESTSQDTVKYQAATKAKVFGGQDTTADTKKHPKENPFNLNEKINPRQAN